MSRHAGGWNLKHVIASVGATIVLGGAAVVFAVVSPAGNPSATAARSERPPAATWHHWRHPVPAPGPSGPPKENNWG